MFTSILTNLELQLSPRTNEDFCIHCNLCVDNCPGKALDEAGRTDLMKCLPHSLPYGVRADIKFWLQLFSGTPEEKKKMLASEKYQMIRQSHYLGNQYQCFNCMKLCPVGQIEIYEQSVVE